MGNVAVGYIRRKTVHMIHLQRMALENTRLREVYYDMRVRRDLLLRQEECKSSRDTRTAKKQIR